MCMCGVYLTLTDCAPRISFRNGPVRVTNKRSGTRIIDSLRVLCPLCRKGSCLSKRLFLEVSVSPQTEL